MQSTTHKTEILETFSSLRNLSYQEKKAGFLSEEKVNSFLDAILEFKKNLKEKTLEINHINEKIEKLTWFNNLDEESLMLLNDLISSAKDLKSSLIRQYISMNPLRKKGIATDEIRKFKTAIDELQESYEDLESVYFFLPEMPDFIETTNKLSLV